MLNLLPHRRKRAAMGQGASFGDRAMVISSARDRGVGSGRSQSANIGRALGATGGFAGLSCAGGRPRGPLRDPGRNGDCSAGGEGAPKPLEK